MTYLRKEQYQSLLFLSGGLGLIGWRFHCWWLPVFSAAILLCGLLSTYLLVKITDLWLWIGEMIGAIMSRVILGAMFIFFLTPLAVLYRTFSGRDRRERKESYFVDRSHTYTAADLEKIF